MPSRDSLSHDLLTPEEEQELAKKMLDGCEESRDKLIKCNLRLVFTIAFSFFQKSDTSHTIDDLNSEGVRGLIKAVDRFKPGMGSKFSSYAAWWIKQAIRKKLIEESTPMRIPASVGKHRPKIIAFVNLFKEEHGRNPYLEEVMERFPSLSRGRILSLMDLSSIVSIHSPFKDSEGDYIIGTIENTKAPCPDEMTSRAFAPEEVQRAMRCLDEREKLIVELRFGISGGRRVWTLADVARVVGLTRERIRQIQKRALEKMRENIGKGWE